MKKIYPPPTSEQQLFSSSSDYTTTLITDAPPDKKWHWLNPAILLAALSCVSQFSFTIGTFSISLNVAGMVILAILLPRIWMNA